MPLEILRADRLTPAQTSRIETFLDSQQTAHPFQLPQWGGPSSMAAWFSGDGTIQWYGLFGVQPVLGRKLPWIRAWTSNRGPVCDDLQQWTSAIEELAEALHRERIAYLEVAPDWLDQTEFAGTAERFSGSHWQPSGIPRSSLRLDITKSDDELLANFRKNSRYEIRRAERSGISVETASTDAEVEEFLSLYQEMAGRKHFAADPADSIRGILSWLTRNPLRGVLLLARSGTALAGGTVVVRVGGRCWYVWGASAREAQATAGHILQWRALQWAKARGCSEYDFGGYTPGATSGPAFFKAGFGGSVVHFVPTHRRVLRSGRYRIAQLVR